MTRIVVIYILSTLLIYAVLGFQYSDSFTENLDVYWINIAHLLATSALLIICLRYENIKVKHLLSITLVFNLAFGSFYTFSINDHTGLLFQYVPSDAPFYDEGGRQVSDGNLLTGVSKIVDETKYGFDDMGMILYVGAIYKIYDSPILVKIINLIINTISTLLIYKLGREIMSHRFALLAALCFSVSSFNLWFLISGLKEPVMVAIILVYFFAFIKYIRTKELKYLLVMSLSAPLLMLFRPAVLIFLLLATLSGFLFRKGINAQKAIAIMFMIGILGTGTYIFKEPISILLKRENSSVYKGEEEKSSKINLPLVAAAGIFGPFATIVPQTEDRFADVSVYAASLILKMVISLFFVYGSYYLFRERLFFAIPLIVFCYTEIMALTIIDNTFKLRYAFPHLPLLYIVGFYGLYLVYEKRIYNSKILGEIGVGFQIGTIGLTLLWNILRL